MKTKDIIVELKKCIKNAHEYTSSLGKSTAIHRNYFTSRLNDISPTEIHIALLEMKEKGEIEFSANDSDIILLTEDFK